MTGLQAVDLEAERSDLAFQSVSIRRFRSRPYLYTVILMFSLHVEHILQRADRLNHTCHTATTAQISHFKDTSVPGYRGRFHDSKIMYTDAVHRVGVVAATDASRDLYRVSVGNHSLEPVLHRITECL